MSKFTYIPKFLAIIWLGIGLYFLWVAIDLSFFLTLTTEQQQKRTQIDKIFPLFVFGGVGIGFILYAWKTWSTKEASEVEVPHLPRSNVKINRKKFPVPPMPEAFAEDKVGKVLNMFEEFDITLTMADPSLETAVRTKNEFAQVIWEEIHHQAMGKNNWTRDVTIDEFSTLDTYIVLAKMEEWANPDTLENVLSIPWDIDNFTYDYKNIALDMVKLSQGDLPLENIEEVVLDKERLSRELRFDCCGKSHVYGITMNSYKGLNIEPLKQLTKLLRQQNKAYRFALVEDDQAIIIRLREDQLSGLSGLFDKGDCKWLEDA